MSNSVNQQVNFNTLDRQWDARFNVPTQEDLDILLAAVQSEWNAGKFHYALVGGVEVGDRPYQNDYLIRHVHCAFIYANRVTKSSILKNLKIKTGQGYYLVPRRRDLTFKGWREHHIKEKTKINENRILYEEGTLPQDREEDLQPIVKRSDEEKKRKLDDIILEMKTMIENNQEDECFKKFPRNFLTYGQKIKAMMVQKRDFFELNGDPHIWIYGQAGAGKSALFNFVYPKSFNKNLDNKFFDLLRHTHHTHILLNDVDHQTLERLGVQFFKTICDEGGYPVDQKYLTPQAVRKPVIVSSNYRIEEVLPEDLKGRHEALAALYRRYWQVEVTDLLRALGLKLLHKYELGQLKKQGNTDPSKVFISWDYLRDLPAAEPLGTPEHYAEKIRELYYGKTNNQKKQKTY